MKHVLIKIVLLLNVFYFIHSNLQSQNNEWYIPATTDGYRFLRKINSIAVDKDNNIYFGDAGNGILIYNWSNWSGYFTHTTGIPSDDVYQIFFDNDGNLWCATGWGIGKFDGNKWSNWNSSKYPVISDNEFFALCLDSTGTAWFGNYLGLYSVKNSECNKITDLGVWVDALCADNNNNVWVGTFGEGVWKSGNGSWRYIEQDVYEPEIYISPPTSYYSRAITKDYLGNIWYTPNHGVVKYDGETFRLWDKERSEIPSNYIYHITADKDNNIWIGSDSGLTKFDGVNFTTYNRTNSPMPSDFVNAIAIDSIGHKWITCYLPWLGETRVAVFREGGTVFTTDVEDNDLNSSFSVYPNPASDKILLSLNITEQSQINISLYNNLGTKLATLLSKQYDSGTYSETIDISKIPSGAYILRFVSANKNHFEKLFILR